MPFLFPGHRYLGPGNPLFNGEPVDEDDRIARDHDQLYEKAQSDKDIFEADKHSAKEFFKDFTSGSGSWHSLVGGVGLTGKNFVEERLLGKVLYGRIGRKRERSPITMSDNGRGEQEGGEDGGGQSRAKRQRTGPEQQQQQQAQQRGGTPSKVGKLPGGAGIGSGDSQNTNETIQQILRVPRDRGVVTVYNDSKILITWAYAMKKMEILWHETNKFNGIITSMARLPVDRPYLYMTYANYQNLAPNSQALHCKAKVTPHGIRTPWKTGSTVVQPVNSDMMVYGVTSVGLNHYMDTCMATIKGVTTNTMKPQEVKIFTRENHQKLSQYFWGQPPGAPLSDDMETIPTCMSVPRHNFAYDYIISHNISPRLNKYTNVFPFKGHIGLPAVNYEHTFEQAWLKWGNNYAGGNDFLTHSAMAVTSGRCWRNGVQL